MRCLRAEAEGRGCWEGWLSLEGRGSVFGWEVGCREPRAASISSGTGEEGEVGRGGCALGSGGCRMCRGGEVVGDEVREGATYVSGMKRSGVYEVGVLSVRIEVAVGQVRGVLWYWGRRVGVWI